MKRLPRVRVTYSGSWGTGTLRVETFRVLTLLEMMICAHNALRRDDQ